MTNAQRVVLNTGAMYARVALTTVLGLFTSRFILAALGVVDLGLYYVIAGVMGFMAFLNEAMATSSQRHLTHELGRGDLVQLNRIFKTAFVLHASLAGLLIILGETVGLWFLTHVLKIPEARREAAFWIYQFTVFTTACSILSVPYQALLTAHEALAAVAFIGMIRSSLVFLMALFIVHAPGDKLVFYVMASSAIGALMILAQVQLCRCRYAEARLRTAQTMNRRLTAELLGFSGWSLFGSLSVVGRLQGLAFLLNIFFGPAVNAAYGIANQVNGMVYQMTQSMLQAISPRLVKQEGAGNRRRMLELSMLTSKYSFFLACFWAIPLFAEMNTVLTLWLKHPPEHSVFFCRVILLMFVCDQLSAGLSTAVLAIGNIAHYQIVIGSIHLATLPLAYAFLKFGFNQNAVLLCSLATVIGATAARGLVVRRVADLPYATWANKVVLRGLLGILPAVVCAALCALVMPPSLGCLLALSLATGFVTVAGAFYFGMSSRERANFSELLKPAFLKLVSRNGSASKAA